MYVNFKTTKHFSKDPEKIIYLQTADISGRGRCITRGLNAGGT